MSNWKLILESMYKDHDIITQLEFVHLSRLIINIL